MSFNRLLALTYNGITIGTGSTLGVPDGGWSLSLTPETGIVKMRFVVAAANANAIANMATIEAGFSVRRKKLTIVYNSATTINTFDPALASLTGYEAFPEIRHGPEIAGPHSIGAETYEITVRFRRPADNNGRRDEHPALQKSLAERRRVRFDGVWTAVSGSAGAREQFSDATTGFEPHATTFLSDYDNTVSWVEIVHDVIENDTDTEVSYHVEFAQHVHGQLNEERTTHQDLHQLRRVLVAGTWVDPAGVQSGSAYAALAAFNDATNGFVAQINTWLAATYSGATFALYALDPRVNVINGTVEYAAELWETEDATGVNTGRRFSRLTLDQTPSLRHFVTLSMVYMQTVVSGTTKTALENFYDATNGYVGYITAIKTALVTVLGVQTDHWDDYVTKRFNYNEQVGILEAEFTFKEIIGLNQSPVGAHDTDLIDDQWDLISSTEGPGDSPAVLGGGTQSAGGSPVKRPVRLEAVYRVWVKFGVDPMTKWTATLQAYVIQTINTQLKPASVPGALLRIVPEVDPRNNVLTAHISMESFTTSYLELSIEENVSRDFGLIFTPRLSGEGDDYVEQQGPSMGTKVRTTRLLSTASGAIYNFQSGKSVGGYRLLRRSVGTRTLVVGVSPVQTTLYAAEMVEEFLAVGASSDGGDVSQNPGTQEKPGTGNQGANGGGGQPGGSPQPSGPAGGGGPGIPSGKPQGSGGNLSEFGPGSTIDFTGGGLGGPDPGSGGFSDFSSGF